MGAALENYDSAAEENYDSAAEEKHQKTAEVAELKRQVEEYRLFLRKNKRRLVIGQGVTIRVGGRDEHFRSIDAVTQKIILRKLEIRETESEFPAETPRSRRRKRSPKEKSFKKVKMTKAEANAYREKKKSEYLAGMI